MRSPLEPLDGERLDALILGGGITGAAIAARLARRGHSVALVERRDVAWGTSGRSSRLIHGGLRYLAGGHLRLVRESLRARRDLIRIAPHLVRPCPFLLPIDADDPLGWRLSAPLGVWLYDLLSRPRRGWPAPRSVSSEEVEALLPGFDTGGVTRTILYHDGWTDDRRLTLLTSLDATRAGATIATRCEMVAIESADGGTAQATLRDTLDGSHVTVTTRAVVNATGAWVDRVRRQLGVAVAPKDKELVRPTRGAHLIVPGRIDAAALLRHPRDGRVVFLIPAIGGFMVGTTDDDDRRHPDEIDATPQDTDYLVELLEHAFPGQTHEVRAAYAGLRPLVSEKGDPDAVSRKSRVVDEKVCGVPLLSVVGGKLTLHRPMALDLTRRLERKIGPPKKSKRPVSPALPGGEIVSPTGEEAAARAYGLTPLQARWMVSRYGSLWRAVLDGDGIGATPLGEGEIPLAAEVPWSMREEGARTLSDLLMRLRVPEISDDESTLVADASATCARIDGWSVTRREREERRWREERELLYGPVAPVPGLVP